MISWLEYLFDFSFFYPLLMAWIWIVGGLWFFFKHEFTPSPLPIPNTEEGCSIIIPCFNEEAQIHETIRYALQTQYPKFEVIAVNDGSSDRTAEILDQLQKKNPRLRVVHLAENQGKAIALRSGTLVSQYEYLICIDGDALLHPHAILWMMQPLVSHARVGAVTGNPRIINRSSILGKLQVGEFSSIIGLIKRAQRTYGRVFTISGVIAGFRKTALERVEFWSDDKITEDIDISWKLQCDHWDIQYIPQALCYIYMPETLKGLWKQRLRWSQGGIEVLKDYIQRIFKWRLRRMWPIILEGIVSIIWAYTIALIFILFIIGLVIPLPNAIYIKTLFPEWYGAMLGLTCLIQFAISLWIDKRYDGQNRFIRNYFWVIWYPIFFWLLTTLTTITALPKTLLQKKKRARWVSPDRGFNGNSSL
ncbi:poly-beta-1,6-N-acetyl-D-glucosamine synthase [Acinetobacter nectaris]|uniref:poly-beta-1,6-N-acetyl-D-glucosamine synthase n=1 Tax=Acinetobacter nectaris TaxID=1219382 RepID=UPI001F017959|nr:poly-beta-1,6-N-acetyl-D-glucosamine synthase [Acinetobacter nectaris]MCF8998256.1 poly-beta-1,6 N-acetyl-D-glucosamine synthase [Acinetobacter nectaris]MCF9026818.1 poly-beta-1,6 N-acetyl-D-glucosamine synthase [Acinetobacter nectaris]